jgi:WD40 repeat protein
LTDRHLVLPTGRTKRAAPAHRPAQGFDFRLGLRGVDVLHPIFRQSLGPNGRHFASGDDDGTLRLWDADTGRELAHWQAHKAGLTALAFHPDGSTLISGASDGTLKVWNLPYIRKELAVLGLDW